MRLILEGCLPLFLLCVFLSEKVRVAFPPEVRSYGAPHMFQ